MVFNKLKLGVKQLKLKQLSFKIKTCQLCGWKLQIKLQNNEMGIRCTHCYATPVSQMMGKIFKQYSQDNDEIYELSSRGAFVRFLKKQNIRLTLSEYFDEISPGQCVNGVLCQNVEELTFEDESFDVCTSLEVFEHVENDRKGFKEIYRVLKPNGVFFFTVPLNLKDKTVERTCLENGIRKNVLPPEYHSDQIRGTEKVFCYRNYGYDIVERLKNAGFKHAKIIQAPENELWGFARPVVLAMK